MPRFVLRVAYDGSDFAGCWRQPGKRTINGTIEEALARLGEPQCHLIAASRTDAGVHAHGQLLQVDCQRDWEAPTLCHQLNAQLPDDVACRAVSTCAADFDLLASVVRKTYHYHLDLGPIRDPFAARTAWRPPLQPTPDLSTLNALSAPLWGLHDWRGLKRRGDYRVDYRVHLTTLRWFDKGKQRICELSANRFTYRLARSLVAMLWAAGRGDISAEDLAATLRGKPSHAMRHQAPAKGLCLKDLICSPPISWQTADEDRYDEATGSPK